MTKDDLLGIFRTCENNCKVVYASSIIFSEEETFSQFIRMYETFEIPKPYDDLYSILYDRDLLCHAFEEKRGTLPIFSKAIKMKRGAAEKAAPRFAILQLSLNSRRYIF